MEAHAQASGSRPAEGEAGAPGQAEASGSGQAPFVPSPAFTGARQGYVFKLGREGVGYYLDGAMLLAAGSSHPPPAADSRPKPAKPAPLKPKGMVIKSSSIVKVKGAKPATAPDAKKRKLDEAKADKPAYLAEMDRYKAMSCSGDTKHDRPLVK